MLFEVTSMSSILSLILSMLAVAQALMPFMYYITTCSRVAWICRQQEQASVILSHQEVNDE